MKFGTGAVLALSVACTACAGDEIPALDWDLANEIATAYGGGSAIAGGAAGASGAGGSAISGTGGSAAGASGSGADLSGPASAAAGGTGAGTMVSAAGSGATSAGGSAPANPVAEAPVCDGFAILAANCGTSGCHGESSNLGTFAASEVAARGYIGKSGTVTCAGQGALINPADPPASILVQKLGDSPPCGNHMPLAGALLTAAEVDCIEDWIGSL